MTVKNLNPLIKRRKAAVKACRPFQIRDCREKEWFMVDDAYLNGWAKICGVYATAVYFSLCRHVNKDQMCWPSVGLLAKEHSMSYSAVYRSLKVLQAHRIISVNKMRGQPNVYTLTNKKHWVKNAKPVEYLEVIDASTYVHNQASL